MSKIHADAGPCFYCRMPLLSYFEQDHAPIPARHGGEQTVPTCENCHALKDRIPARSWPLDLQMQALEECGPLGRIFLAKAFAIACDNEALAEAEALENSA